MKKGILCSLVCILIISIELFSGCVGTGGNIVLNSGFELGRKNEPFFWYQAIVPNDNLTMLWDTTVCYNGSYSAGIHNTHVYENETCNNWAQRVYKVPLGKTVELTGWIKTIESDDVVMIIQCWDLMGTIVGFGSTETSGSINGTNDWKEYNASVFVPYNTTRIIVRLALCGTGQVWFDDVKLSIK